MPNQTLLLLLGMMMRQRSVALPVAAQLADSIGDQQAVSSLSARDAQRAEAAVENPHRPCQGVAPSSIQAQA